MANEKKITWDASFNVGIDDIDDQHRILVNTINEADQKLSEDASQEVLENITKDLLSYALYHFETEEEMMQAYNYQGRSQAEYEAHMKQHRDFSAQVVAIRESIRAGSPIDKEELLEFLVDWLTNHIQNTDKKLGAFLQDAMK